MTSSTPPPQQHSSRRMGLSMFVIAWLILFALLAWYFNDWLSEQFNPNQSPSMQTGKNSKEVVLHPNRQHHYVVSGDINGSKVVFLLDTGATEVVVPAALAARLRLKAGQKQYAQTANGRVAVYSTLIEDINIGGIRFHNVKASINPGMAGDVILLGMSALRQIEFSQRGDTLILRQ